MKLHKHEGKQFRILQCEPDIQWAAKNRGGRLQRLEQPNIQNMIDKLTVQTNGGTASVSKEEVKPELNKEIPSDVTK